MVWHVRAQISDIETVSAMYLFIRNTLFYLNPLHSIALFAPLAIVGFFIAWKKYLLAAISVPLSILPGALYHTASSRYLIATIPLLLIFAIEGIRYIRRYLPLWVMALYVGLACAVHVGMTCIYTLPQCHASADRAFSFLPREIGISQEGVESGQEALDWINAHAESNSAVTGSNIWEADVPIWNASGRLRADLILATQPSCTVATYDMDQSSRILAPGETVYMTKNWPRVRVSVIKPEHCHVNTHL
jgi:hypothetical protein